MADTETRLREALEHMFETAEDNGNDHLEVTPQELAHAAEVEGKTDSVPIDAARAMLSQMASGSDESHGEAVRFALPR